MVHDSAVQCASLKERLHSKATELAAAAAQVAELKQQNILLASEHSHHLDALQEGYESRLRDYENMAHERHSSTNEEQRHAFEMAVQALEREVERAMDAAVHAAEQPVSASLPYSPSASASAYSSALDAASSSLSPSRGTIGGGGQAQQSSFHVTAVTLLKQQLLHRLDATFHALHQSRARLSAEAQQVQSQLQHQLASQSAVEADMSRRLAALGESHASEMRMVQGGGQQEQLLLDERAAVIRELKRRYKREQAASATIKTQLVQLRSQLQQMHEQHALDVQQWRDLSNAELRTSIHNVESIAAKRLDAENRLRRRAEEEADRSDIQREITMVSMVARPQLVGGWLLRLLAHVRCFSFVSSLFVCCSYVRACTQSEHKIFQLQQEKAQLITFFKQQLQEARMHSTNSRPGDPSASAASSRSDADALLDEKLKRHLALSSASIASAAASSFNSY